MYGSFLVFLLAIVIQGLAPADTSASWTIQELIHLLAYPLAVWGGLRFRFRRLMARALHDEAEARRLRAGFSGLVEGHQAALLGPFALLAYATSYPGLVVEPASGSSLALGGLLGVLPFLLFVAILWWEAYPLQGVLYGQTGTRLEFLGSHARMELPVLLPWVLLLALLDGLRQVDPSGYNVVKQNPLVQLRLALAFLVVLMVLLPVLVKALWGCTPVPAGPLRERLERLTRSLGVRARDVLLWPLLGGKVLNAGIFGLLPRFRYLLVTPALLETLSPAELDGVIAHEAGHVRHRHLWFFLLVSAGYVFLATVFLRLTDAGFAWWDPDFLRGPHGDFFASASMTVALGVLLVGYFRVAFGLLSRTFERQADLYALEALRDPLPLISALERISIYSGDIRDLPSWHHGSIAERVSFLMAAASAPETARRFRRFAFRVQAAFALGVALFGAATAILYSRPVEHRLDVFAAERALVHRLGSNPRDARLWLNLALLRQEEGDLHGAEKAYVEVIRLAPRQALALNNLAWLYATAEESSLYRPERALALAELAVRIEPSAQVLDTLAEARFRVRDRAGAVEAIDAALAAKPPNPSYYLAQRRRFQEARP